MKKYRAVWAYTPRIEAFDVEKETELTVTYRRSKNSRLYRENKTASDHGWFDSFGEAKTALVAAFREKVVTAQYNLQRANERVSDALDLTEEV